MKNLSRPIRLLMAFILALTLAGLFVLAETLPASATAPLKLSISSVKKTLTPFDILTIKGKGLDQAAATSAVFTLESGESYTIPAIRMTSSAVEVQVPPAGYSEKKGVFTKQKTSLKVIQIKEEGGNLAVTASNELSGFTITAPRIPRTLKKPSLKNLPKGSLSKAFLAVSLFSLQSVEDKLAMDNPALSASLKQARKTLEELQEAIKTVVKNPKAEVKLPTNTDADAILNVKALARLDALYSAYLGIAEKKLHLADTRGMLAFFLPTALAAGDSACVTQGLGDPNLSEAEKEMYRFVCISRDSALEKTPIAMEAIKKGMRFIWSLPATVGSLILGGESLLEMTLADEILLATAQPLVMEMTVLSKEGAKDAGTDIITGLIADKLFGDFPLLDMVTDMAGLFNEVHKGVYGKDLLWNFKQAIFPIPGTNPPQIQYIRSDKTAKTDQKILIGALNTPADSLSLILGATGVLDNGFQIISNLITAPPLPPSQPEPEPEPEKCPEPKIDTYHTCTAGCDAVHDLIEKSNCINKCIGDWLKSSCP